MLDPKYFEATALEASKRWFMGNTTHRYVFTRIQGEK